MVERRGLDYRALVKIIAGGRLPPFLPSFPLSPRRPYVVFAPTMHVHRRLCGTLSIFFGMKEVEASTRCTLIILKKNIYIQTERSLSIIDDSKSQRFPWPAFKLFLSFFLLK